MAQNQVPTSLTVVPPVQTVDTKGKAGEGDYGIKVGVKYQINDQNGKPIESKKMKLGETLSGTMQAGNETINLPAKSGVPGAEHPNSKGQFMDTPVGATVDRKFTLTLNQTITVTVGDQVFTVRTNQFKISSDAPGHGTITNGGDINASQ